MRVARARVNRDVVQMSDAGAAVARAGAGVTLAGAVAVLARSLSGR